jgi:demethylmenaquinone methyltransferase/2-methoxy-6-polyprenyl-1,4-benzoquinol methylase
LGAVTPGPASPFTDEGELPTGAAKATAVRSMFDAIAPRYDLVNRIMTFRLDVGWRKRTVGALRSPPGTVVLDIACGTGDLCRELARGGLRPVGADLSLGMLAAARTDAPLLQGDALRLPLPPASVGAVTCGFALRNFVDLQGFFAEVARILRPGGRIAFLEVAEPPNRLLRRGHAFYFGTVVPRIGALLSDADAYRYLPRSVAYLPEPPRLLADLRAAGFPDAERTLLTGGIAQLLTGTRS